MKGDDELNGPDLRPYAGHGTFIAGVVRCVAPETRIYVEGFAIGGVGGGGILESDLVVQLEQALRHDPQVINLSAGCRTRRDRPSIPLRKFHRRHLEGRDCVLVAAAGNDSWAAPFWPAAFDWCVGVGSLDRDGRVSAFSNFGVSADVYALGRNLVNAFPDGTFECNETPDKGDIRVFSTGMARWSGTSFSAPVVAGLIAREISETGASAPRRARRRAGPRQDQTPTRRSGPTRSCASPTRTPEGGAGPASQSSIQRLVADRRGVAHREAHRPGRLGGEGEEPHLVERGGPALPVGGLDHDLDGPHVTVEVEQLSADLAVVELGVERPALGGGEVEDARRGESPHLGSGLVARVADEGEHLPLRIEVGGSDGSDHRRDEAGRRRVIGHPHVTQFLEESGVPISHRSPPFIRAVRTFARHRARVGPMLPTGMSRSWLIDW